MVAGETVTCTFTNTKRGNITIEKQTLPDGSTAKFTFAGDVAGTISDGETIVVSGLVPGTYTSSETVPVGWDISDLSCDDGQSLTPSTYDMGTATATLKLDPGESMKCTFTNTQRGSITVEKQTLPDGMAQTFDFTGTTLGTIGDGNSITVSNLIPGNYSSIETLVDNWELTSIVCDDGQSLTPSTFDLVTATADFKLDPGEIITCIFTNTYIPPMDATFKAIKVWDGGYTTDHIAVPLTLWRQIEGGQMVQLSNVTPDISPSTPTSDSYIYNWTGLARTDEHARPYIYYATEELYKYYQRQYNLLFTDGANEYCAATQGVCTITNVAPSPASSTMIGIKIWQDGPAIKPAVWLQLMQSENGGASVPYLTPVMLDGIADAACTSGCEKLPWQAIWLNVPTTDNMEKTWTYTVKEVNASGADWKPDNYTKVESGMTVTNTFVPPTLIDPPVAFKIWANFSGPYPTVWLHLYRQIQGGNPQAVGSPVPLDGVAGGDCTVGCEIVAWSARWDGLKATDLLGNVYVYFVKETDASGADWVPANFTKTEVGMTVTNTYVPGPTPTIIVTIPKTGSSGGSMTAYGLLTLITLMAFAGMQIMAAKKKKS